MAAILNRQLAGCKEPLLAFPKLTLFETGPLLHPALCMLAVVVFVDAH